MKLTLFTWIPASSAGMTILLFAAQLNAAGVCIVCPPGYECPTGGGPVLAGEPGRILQRTATGAQWVTISDIIYFNARGQTGEHIIRDMLCPVPPRGPEHIVAHARCSRSSTDPSSTSLAGAAGLGEYCWCQAESRARPGCFSRWQFFHRFSSSAMCADQCTDTCRGGGGGDITVWR